MARSFDSPMPGSVYLSALDVAPIRMPGWEEPLALCFRDIDGRAFLNGVAMHPASIAYCAKYFEERDAELSVSALVHVVKLFHEAGATGQSLPSSADLVEQLLDMRQAATRLSHLAQGYDGKGQPTASPDWFTSENGFDVESDGSLHPTLQRAMPDIHPMLHEALHTARATGFPGGLPRGDAERKAWMDTGVFFMHLRLWVKTIDTAVEQIRSESDVSKAPANRPPHDARKWALSRLLWIWRDIIGKPINLSMRKIRGKVELEVPEPGPCITFILAAMAHIEPVQPNEYCKLQTRLGRLRRVVPEENLVKS